jgi:glycosyltransferase involved in cell wall biosynthesis
MSPVFWPEVRRGSERFVRDLADGLIARGQHPRLLTSHGGLLPRRTVEDGLEVVRNPRLPSGRLERRNFEHHLGHVPFAYLSLRRGEDDIAHAVYVTDAAAALRWARHSGRPVVYSAMGIPHRAWLANRRRRLELTLAAVRGASATVVLSRAAADAFDRWLGVRPEVIPPGVDTAAFTPGGDRAPAPTIICPAALGEERKRGTLLLEAFSAVRRSRPDARLVLSRPAGDSSPPPGAGVELADLDDRAALAEAYRRAWVCALPSRSEAFGLVLAEALACGTPAVGSNDGGIPEVVDRPEVGRLFDGDDPAALARALLEAFELAADPATAATCRARAVELSLDRCAERYLELYRRLA